MNVWSEVGHFPEEWVNFGRQSPLVSFSAENISAISLWLPSMIQQSCEFLHPINLFSNNLLNFPPTQGRKTHSIPRYSQTYPPGWPGGLPLGQADHKCITLNIWRTHSLRGESLVGWERVGRFFLVFFFCLFFFGGGGGWEGGVGWIFSAILDFSEQFHPGIFRHFPAFSGIFLLLGLKIRVALTAQACIVWMRTRATVRSPPLCPTSPSFSKGTRKHTRSCADWLSIWRRRPFWDVVGRIFPTTSLKPALLPQVLHKKWGNAQFDVTRPCWLWRHGGHVGFDVRVTFLVVTSRWLFWLIFDNRLLVRLYCDFFQLGSSPPYSWTARIRLHPVIRYFWN